MKKLWLGIMVLALALSGLGQKRTLVVCSWGVLMHDANETGLALQATDPKIDPEEFKDKMTRVLEDAEKKHSKCKAKVHYPPVIVEYKTCPPDLPLDQVTQCMIFYSERIQYLTPRSLFWELLKKRSAN